MNRLATLIYGRLTASVPSGSVANSNNGGVLGKARLWLNSPLCLDSAGTKFHPYVKTHRVNIQAHCPPASRRTAHLALGPQ